MSKPFNKIFEFTEIQYVRNIPRITEHGILYISNEFELAIHLCACGCGIETVTPFNKGEWSLSKNENNEVSLRPSIGNFNGEKPYHAHYWIKDSKIKWCK